MPSPPDFSNVDHREIEAFIDLCRKEKHVINSRFFLKKIPDYFKKNLTMPAIRPRCLLPYIYLECNPYGNISPCMVATGWETGISIEDYADQTMKKEFRKLQQSLESCRKCDTSMYICCWEPMINFPVSHFLRYGLLG